MEIKKTFNFKISFAVLYFVAFLIYVIIGLHPVGAKNYSISASLKIPAIGLVSDVTALSPVGSELETPDYIVGSYSEKHNKVLLIGHSVTVFQNLDLLKIGDFISYDNVPYRVYRRFVADKDTIKMSELLVEEEINTVVLMTCTGQEQDDGNFSHRLVIFAQAV